MKEAPCLNCPERKSGCHSNCEKYIQFKTERDAELVKRRKATEKDNDMYGYKEQKYKRLGK